MSMDHIKVFSMHNSQNNHLNKIIKNHFSPQDFLDFPVFKEASIPINLKNVLKQIFLTSCKINKEMGTLL